MREKKRRASLATLTAVQWTVSGTVGVVKKTVSGVPGAAGRAVTQVVEEEQNTELGTVLRQKMEAGSV